MTTYTAKQLQEMSAQQLERIARELRSDIQQLSFQARLGELKQVRQVRLARRTLARVLTLTARQAKAAMTTKSGTTPAQTN
jgi:ribosomal protein L29